jgi:hypothetical protein
MSDDTFRLPYLPETPLQVTKTRPPERLSEFRWHGRWVWCDLRYHGEYGVEALFGDDSGGFYGRRFDTRAEAAAWAARERDESLS